MRYCRIIPVLSAVGIAACAFTPHEVAVNASAPVEPSSIGAGRTIYLEVIDDRETEVVGQRGAGMQGADITASQVMPTLERELIAGFTAKGFSVSTTDRNADAEVEARLRASRFFLETGFFAGAKNTSVVVGIEADNGRDDYDRTYRSSSEDSTMVVPAGSDIDAHLNAAFTEVLRQIMADDALMEFLATPKGVS